MKQIIFLLAMMGWYTLVSQNVTNVNLYTDQQALDVSIDDAMYAVIDPNEGDAFIAKFDLNGSLLQQQVFPNDNPSFNISSAREVSAHQGLVFATVNTFANVSGGLNRSESLFAIPEDLTVTSDDDRLVAYNSEFYGLYNNENFVYLMYSASTASATLSINNVDGTAASIIPNPGNGSFIRTWLLKIDANDVTNVIAIVPIGDTSNNTFAQNNTVDNQILLPQGIIELDNGAIVIEYTDSAINPGDTYLEVFDPINLNRIELLGPFDQDVSITDFNEGYVLGYYDDERLEFLNTDFQVENVTWVFDFSYSPYKMEQFGDFLKVAVSGGSFPGSETSRICFFGERVIESHKRGGITVNWRNYFESFFVSETTTINVANYFGNAFDFEGTPIPEATAGTTHLVIYTTDESGPDNTIAINDSSPDFLEVFQNSKFNPDDPMNLIPGDFDETWITLAPGTIIPGNEVAVPPSWRNSIELPVGFKLAYGGNALMGTDPFAPDGFNRFFTVKIIPNEISNITSLNLTNLVSMRVWVTFNTFNSDSLDSDNDGVDDDLDLCPNTPNGEMVDGNGCSASQLGDDDGDGVINIDDTDPNDPCFPVQAAGYTGFDATHPLWQNADCDGDGEANGEELNCDVIPTDPYDSQDNCASLSVASFNSSTISLYPNPTRGIVQIESRRAIDVIQVFTLAGQLVATQYTTTHIDIGNQPSGLYIIRLLTPEGRTFVYQIIRR